MTDYVVCVVRLQVTYKTELGQLLDLRTASPGGKVDFSNFTMETYAGSVFV